MFGLHYQPPTQGGIRQPQQFHQCNNSQHRQQQSSGFGPHGMATSVAGNCTAGTSPSSGSQILSRMEELSLGSGGHTRIPHEVDIIPAHSASATPPPTRHSGATTSVHLGVQAPSFEASSSMQEARRCFHAAANAALTLHSTREAAFTEAKHETLRKVEKIVAHMAMRDQLNGHIRLSELFPAIGSLAPEPRTARSSPAREVPTTPTNHSANGAQRQSSGFPRGLTSTASGSGTTRSNNNNGAGQTLNGQELDALAEDQMSVIAKELASLYRLQKDCYNEGTRYGLQLVMDAVHRISQRNELQGYIGLSELQLELHSILPEVEGGGAKKAPDAPMTQQLSGRISGCKRDIERREEDDVPSYGASEQQGGQQQQLRGEDSYLVNALLSADEDQQPPPFFRRRTEM